MPEVAPASTAMLQSTRRPEVDILLIVSPWNSSTLKLAPWRADLADEVQNQVLRPDELLETAFHDDLDRRRHLHVEHAASAHTLAISVAPMPNAKAPSAPWLVVCESVPTTT